MHTLFAFALLCSVAASSSSAQASKGPLDSYKAYLEVMATAKSLDDLLPYYTKELRSGLSKMPADMKVSYLQMNRRVLKDLKVTTENIAESKAEFQLTARNADGQATQGSVTMIKEAGVWKIDEDAWVGPPPKKDH